MLRRRAREGDRPKSAIGSVRLEEYSGDRRKYIKWKRAVQAQERLYRLDPSELAMLLYLSTRGEARDVLDQLPIEEYTCTGGLVMLWKLLDETYGENGAEMFERAEQELSSYRLLPGQSMAAYIASMKRLRAQYARIDPESTISDKAWAQRLLNRASLSRRERLDVFYSAGGQYSAVPIENALRHRCSLVHEEERKLPGGRPDGFRHRSASSTTSSLSRSQASTSTRSSSSTRSGGKGRKSHVHVATGELHSVEEEDWEGDYEDLENEDHGVPNIPAEGEILNATSCRGEDEQDEGTDFDDEFSEGGSVSVVEIQEAFQAGWKAKQKAAAHKKARGWKSSRPSEGSSGKSLAERKKSSSCASCGMRGHWRGDPQCPHVKAGKDPLHRPANATAKENEVHYVNFTFMEGAGLIPDVCPSCSAAVPPSAKYCHECGHKNGGKRNPWDLVTSSGVSTGAAVSSDSETQPPRPMKDVRFRASKARVADGRSKNEKEISLKATELLGALPTLSKAEKKEIKYALLREEDESAWNALESHRAAFDPGRARASNDGYPMPFHADRADPQLPVPPSLSGAGASSAEASALAPPSSKTQDGKDKAKSQKQREVEDFRRQLYASSWNGFQCRPSRASPVPTEKQARCPHLFEDLLFTANQHGHFARCSRCDLKNVLYFSVRHGVLMAAKGRGKQEGAENPPHTASGPPGQVVADSGCRTAVAGMAWHRRFQDELRRRGLPWQEVQEHEVFQFGSGGPETSHVAFLYVVGINGNLDVLRMSAVEGGAIGCPGLIGPSELARWSAVFDFRNRTMDLFETKCPMHLTSTRHPAIHLTDYPMDMDDPWSQPAVAEKAELLRKSPQSLAFLAADGGQAGNESDSEGSSHAATSVVNSESEASACETRWDSERKAERRARLEQQWLELLQEDLGVHVVPECVRDRASDAGTASDCDDAGSDDTELRPLRMTLRAKRLTSLAWSRCCRKMKTSNRLQKMNTATPTATTMSNTSARRRDRRSTRQPAWFGRWHHRLLALRRRPLRWSRLLDYSHDDVGQVPGVFWKSSHGRWPSRWWQWPRAGRQGNQLRSHPSTFCAKTIVRMRASTSRALTLTSW